MTLGTNTMILNSEVGIMGQTEKYRVKVPELAAALGVGAMDLVRNCGIAVKTAYIAINKNASGDLTLDSCWKIYTGLRKNGYTIDGRDIRWSDIVEFDE